jgi:hypothetical protein
MRGAPMGGGWIHLMSVRIAAHAVHQSRAQESDDDGQSSVAHGHL